MHETRAVTQFLRVHNSPGAEPLRGGAPKIPNNVASTSMHLLPKDLSLEHGVPNMLLAPGAI